MHSSNIQELNGLELLGWGLELVDGSGSCEVGLKNLMFFFFVEKFIQKISFVYLSSFGDLSLLKLFLILFYKLFKVNWDILELKFVVYHFIFFMLLVIEFYSSLLSHQIVFFSVFFFFGSGVGERIG